MSDEDEQEDEVIEQVFGDFLEKIKKLVDEGDENEDEENKDEENENEEDDEDEKEEIENEHNSVDNPKDPRNFELY